MVITLSAYTQPPPIDTAISVSELPQIRETNHIHENENEQDSFAEILAGVLHKNGEEEQNTEEETPEILFDDLSGVQIDAAAFIGKEINLEKPQAVDIAREEVLGIELSEITLSENETAKDYLESLADMGDMLVTDQPPEGTAAELPQDFFDMGNFERLADFQKEAVKAAAENAQKAVPSETRGREINKDGSLLQAENIEVPLAAGRGKETASLQKDTEKDARGKYGEAQSRGRKDRISFEVRDTRSGGAENQNNATQFKAGAQIVEQARDVPVKEITLELKLPEQAQSSAQTTWEAKAGNALENMLARELHQNFNGDIVRHASMALRDGGEGVIKLALKPDSLGNVKIHLKMSENKITGHIVVESEEALNAFKKEIASLEQAFRESGFENAQLNLSLTADQRNAEWQEQKAPSLLPGIAANRYDESFRADSSAIVDVFYGQKNGSINMLA